MLGYNGGQPYFGAGRSVEINGNLLFTDATNGLWSYNETTGVATQLATLALGSNGGEMTVADGLAYFAARASGGNPTSETALWVTDGTVSGTHLVTTLPDTTPSAPFDSAGISGLSTLADGNIAFAYSDGTDNYVYVSDGSSAGTEPIPDYYGSAPYLGVMQSVELSVACFATGVTLETVRGPVAVERLSAGDRVRSASGGQVSIRWIGHRRIDCRRHPRPHDVWPIRIHAHAFGPNQPRRNLYLSPDHAVFIDGVLIPIRYLVNGRTIEQEPRDEITYWHVELERHGILLAEGLPCESYLDTGNRAAFANGGGAEQMQPDFALKIWDAKACAPLVREGVELEAARSWLLERAARLGHCLTHDPRLRLLADGRSLLAAPDGQRWHVRLTGKVQDLRLVSRSFVPSHTRPGCTDTRFLGVAISRLALDGREIGLDNPLLSAGWHATEPGWRWTDGDARISVAGTREIEFEVAMTGTYWRDDNNDRAAVA